MLETHRDEFIDFSPHSYSHVPPRFYSRASPHTFHVLLLSSLMDLTIAHMVLVHERTTLSLDALVTAQILVMVVFSHVGLVFWLKGPTPTLSRDTWMVHVFSVMVHVPLGQVVRCNGL
jgi:hypothetical protein